MPSLPTAYSQTGSTVPRPMRNKLGSTTQNIWWFKQQANDDLIPSINDRQERADTLGSAADEAILNPVGTAGLFRSFYEDMAKGITAPAFREFANQQDALGANVASRFGGNVSGEEIRQRNVFQDQFSRNLGETLAGMAPQAAQQGLQYTGQLQQAAGNATSEADILRQLLMQGILGTKRKQKKSGLLGALGTAVGAVGGAFLGGPAGAAAGAKAGGAVGGSV